MAVASAKEAMRMDVRAVGLIKDEDRAGKRRERSCLRLQWRCIETYT